MNTYEYTVCRDGTIWTGEHFEAETAEEAEKIGIEMLCRDWDLDVSDYADPADFGGDMDGTSLLQVPPVQVHAELLLEALERLIDAIAEADPENLEFAQAGAAHLIAKITGKAVKS